MVYNEALELRSRLSGRSIKICRDRKRAQLLSARLVATYLRKSKTAFFAQLLSASYAAVHTLPRTFSGRRCNEDVASQRLSQLAAQQSLHLSDGPHNKDHGQHGPARADTHHARKLIKLHFRKYTTRHKLPAASRHSFT